MLKSKLLKLMALLFTFAVVAAACGNDDDAATSGDSATTETTAAGDDMDDMASSAEACDADAIVAMVQGGNAEGTLEGMTDDPVGTAASNNPVLTTLVTAVVEANLVDTLNSAEALTVFAPTDCAFAALDEDTLNAALADPTGLLTTVLGFHVVAGQQLYAAALGGLTEIETFTGEILSIEVNGDTVTVGGQADVLVADIMTANATVHLIDSVMLPPSVTGGDEAAAEFNSAEACDADAIVAAVQGGNAEGTLEGMTDDPVGTAASNNPVLTTLVTAVVEAELVDTLNSAEALTVFAPTDCAFAALDEATLNAALADPTGLLTTVLGFHVVAGQQLDAAALGGLTEIETFTGEILSIEVDGDTITVGGQATVVVGDIMTANATVHLIDSVMLPPSVTG